MTKPPERLLAWPSECYYQGVSLAGGHPDRMVEYIRADLVTQRTPDPAVRALVEAAKRALNFIENTESEMGETIESGDLLRASLAAFDKT